MSGIGFAGPTPDHVYCTNEQFAHMPVHDPFTLVLTRHSQGLSVRRGDRTYLETEAKPNAFPRMQSIGFSEPGGKRERTRADKLWRHRGVFGFPIRNLARRHPHGPKQHGRMNRVVLNGNGKSVYPFLMLYWE